MRSREPAIVLRTTDYSETSQVVHLLTHDTGLVRLLAKGTKRPKSKSGGALDLLVEGDLVFTISDKNPTALGTLIEFSESTSHAALRADRARLNTALYLIELVHDCLGDADPHPEVYELLAKALRRLGQADAPIPAVLAYFQWRLLRHVGLLGGLDACVECGLAITEIPRDATVYFTSRQGGILCDACESLTVEKFRLDPQTLAGLGALAAAERGRKVSLPDAQAHAVNRLLAYHFQHQLGRALRMARHAIAGMPR
jgi:DNA repair protein RecO (recombination protein O)